MSDQIQKLKKTVTELSPVELREFATWLMDFNQEIWEGEIQKDSESGRLDFLREEAQLERRANKLKDL